MRSFLKFFLMGAMLHGMGSCREALAAMTVPPTAAEKQFFKYDNLLTNPGFESGLSGWTLSGGTITLVSAAADVGSGKKAVSFDASSSGQYLRSKAVTIPAGLYGNPCLMSFKAKGFDSNVDYAILSGSNTVASGTMYSTTEYRPYESGVFSCPSSGSLQVQFISTADAAVGYIDDVYLGGATNISNVSQANFVGGMENPGASSCAYAQNSSSGLTDWVDLGTGSSCADWVATSHGPGTISAVGTNSHQLTYTNMPPGEYLFVLTGAFANGNASGGTFNFRLSDGTTAYQPQSGSGASGADSLGSLTFHVSITDVVTRTFKIQASDNAAITPGWYNGSGQHASWKIYRFPTSDETGYKPNQTTFYWEGTHGTNCEWGMSSTTIAMFGTDSSCSFTEVKNTNAGAVTSAMVGSNTLAPGVTFIPHKGGEQYEVCATANAFGDGSAFNATAQMVSALPAAGGTVYNEQYETRAAFGGFTLDMCGVVNSTAPTAHTVRFAGLYSGGSWKVGGGQNQAIRWRIRKMTGSAPTPVLVNSVVSGLDTGAVKIGVAKIDSSAVVSGETMGDMFNGNCVDNSNVYTCTFSSSYFSTVGGCVATLATQPGNIDSPQIDASAFASGQLKITAHRTGTGNVDGNYLVWCWGTP